MKTHGSSGPPSRNPDFAALEGWRGICACLVALYHFRAVLGVPVNSHLSSLETIQHAYLFVDFFFVLSGFVIASRYQERIAGQITSVTDFLKLRLGRLYPLQLLTLLGMIVMYTYVGRAPDAVIGLHAAPIDTHIWSFFANVLLLQGLHTTAAPTWNHPSWSVSTEFATYVVYALLWKMLGKRTWIATACIIVLAPIAIGLLVGHMDTTFDWGILRSLLGFALGVTVFNYLQYDDVQEAMARVTPRMATAIEFGAMVGIGVFVAQPEHTTFSIGAPFVFAFAVLVFSRGNGMVGALLSSRLFRHVGTVSYSVYLLHYPLQQLFMVTALWCYATLGWTWLFAGDPVTTGLRLGASGVAGDATTAVMLTMLLLASTLTWRFVETPCRMWVRARVQGTGSWRK